VGVLGGVTGCDWVEGVADSIDIDSTVLFSFLFLFCFVIPHMFICSYFQNASGMNSVSSIRTMFDKTAWCIKRARYFLRVMSVRNWAGVCAGRCGSWRDWMGGVAGSIHINSTVLFILFFFVRFLIPHIFIFHIFKMHRA
jgi:hypothetical protein